MDKKYYMVRAMASSEADFDIFFGKSVVAVGWSSINFAEYEDADLLAEKVKSVYMPGTIAPQVLGKKLNEVKRFKGIKKGDRIIVPYYNAVRLAVAEEESIFDPSAEDADLSNQRKVCYQRDADGKFKTVYRDELTESLQRRLRVRGTTIADLEEFKTDIEKLFEDGAYAWNTEFEAKERRIRGDFKEDLLRRIQYGDTHLKTGGIGLEHLVKELFICEGYDARVLPKTEFGEGADADVSALKLDRFHSIDILAQVKHHQGFTDKYGLEQLQKIREDERYADKTYVIITSAKVSDEVRSYAENIDIAVIDGEELVEWIMESMDKLSDRTKIELGISSTPRFI